MLFYISFKGISIFVSAVSCVLVTSFQPGEYELLAAHKPCNPWLFVSAILSYICKRYFLCFSYKFPGGRIRYDVLAAHKPLALCERHSNLYL